MIEQKTIMFWLVYVPLGLLAFGILVFAMAGIFGAYP